MQKGNVLRRVFAVVEIMTMMLMMVMLLLLLLMMMIMMMMMMMIDTRGCTTTKPEGNSKDMLNTHTTWISNVQKSCVVLVAWL